MNALTLPIVGKADRVAEQNRARFDLNGVFAVNLIGTASSETRALARRTKDSLGHSVLPVEIDGPTPHRAAQLARALDNIRLGGTDVVLVHNAVDRTCPGSCKLGAHVNVRVTSVFEPSLATLADPQLYRDIDALVVGERDRAGDAAFDEAQFLWQLARVNPNQVVFLISSDGRGLASWVDWITRRRNVQLRVPLRRRAGPGPRPFAQG
jgi:Ni2+-binding GTPase involved in maturation of urease and hydrogenase